MPDCTVRVYHMDRLVQERTFGSFHAAYDFATRHDDTMLQTVDNNWHMLMRLPAQEALLRDDRVVVCTDYVSNKTVELVL